MSWATRYIPYSGVNFLIKVFKCTLVSYEVWWPSRMISCYIATVTWSSTRPQWVTQNIWTPYQTSFLWQKLTKKMQSTKGRIRVILSAICRRFGPLSCLNIWHKTPGKINTGTCENCEKFLTCIHISARYVTYSYSMPTNLDIESSLLNSNVCRRSY